jgi:hypothetical protein
MKIRIPCIKCPTRYVDEMILVEERDDGLYHLLCPSGHETMVWLQQHKFELLLDSGGMALLDGYYRESVASIAAALERFMEFYVRVIFLKHSVDTDSFDKTWKQVIKQSERQIGAFIFVYLIENGNHPPFIDDLNMKSMKDVTNRGFRNKVIHNGYTPSREQVIEYGEQVFKFIHDLFYKLKDSSEQSIQQYISDAINKVKERHPKKQICTQWIRTMISIITPRDQSPQSFEEGLKQIQEVRTIAYGV